MAALEPEAPAADLPDAWKVWAAWQGSAEAVAAIARTIGQHIEQVECIVVVSGGEYKTDPNHLSTDVPPRYWRSFKRILMRGSTGERRIETEFDNERSRTPGRGVSLQVWSSDRDDAVIVRDAIALVIDGGSGPLSGKPRAGPLSSESADDALTALSTKRDDKIWWIAMFAAVGLIWSAALLHSAISPASSSLADLVLFCVCNKLIFVVMSAIAIVVAITAAPRIFPPIEISDRSTWHRFRGRVVSLGVVTYVLSAGVDAIDKVVR